MIEPYDEPWLKDPFSTGRLNNKVLSGDIMCTQKKSEINK